MALDGKFYRYFRGSYGFLDRAKAARDRFVENHDVESLFVAALMLRTGIEARLFEYIEASMPTEGRKERLARISEYTATRLLSRLCGMNPDAKREVELRIYPSDGGGGVGMRYTPVTDSLASVHGKLGELLHYNYFHRNPFWFIADRLDAPGLPTLLHAQDLFDRGIEELTESCSGTLLSHPRFSQALEQLESEASALPTDGASDG